MKKLITLLAIDAGRSNYLESAVTLINEILNFTKHDVIVTTNDSNFFTMYENSDRVTIKTFDYSGINLKDSTGSFNYNLKFLAFEDIDYSQYSAIIYFDADIKLTGWGDDMEQFIDNILSDHDVIGTRFNYELKQQLLELKTTGNCLFKHKIDGYGVEKLIDSTPNLINAKLPSEHFLIIKGDGRIQEFAKYWRYLNSLLQETNCPTWGDGFEIGISLEYAGYNSIKNSDAPHRMGVVFNGNKN